MSNAISTTDFINTLGVDTHIGIAGAYSDIPMVEQDLEYLGVTIVRDSIDSASVIPTWEAVAQATGIKFDDFMPEGAPAWDQSALALLPQLAQAGLLAYIEGGNEEDDPYATANGNSLSWTAQFQQQVYADAQQYGIPVINMSFGQGWTAANNWEGDYASVGNLSAYTNYANAHTYPNPGETPSAAISLLNTDAKLAASSRPVITTEIGWQTSQFSATAIAQYAVDATFDGIVDGDAGMWFYGLYDDSSGTWGLFNSDGSPRPVATALHDLTTLLTDTGSNAATFSPGSLAYSLAGTQSGDNSFLMEKSNGSYWIGLWNEGGTQHTVTVTLPSAAAEIEVFDPVTGITAAQSASNANSISISLGADPLLVEIVPDGASTTGTTSSGAGATSTGSSSGSTDPSGSSSGTSSGASSSSGAGGTTSTSSSSGTSGSTTAAATPQDLSLAVPAAISATAGKTEAISGISVSDAWAAGNPGVMALNVWDQSGSLTLDGETFGPGGGPVAYGMLSGTLAQINADLASLTYTAAASGGTDIITVDVWNQAGVEQKQTIAVTVAGSSTTSSAGSTASADPPATGPVITTPSAETAGTGATIAVKGISVADAFAASNPGVMALNISATAGTISMTNSTGATVAGSGTGTIAVTGTLAQLNAELATLTYTAGKSAGTGSIAVNVWDQAGSQTTESISVGITAGSTGSTGAVGSTSSAGTTSSPSATNSTILIPASEADAVELTSNATIQATSGNHMIFLGGTGNTLTATGGNETVQAFQGHNTITTGAGNDTISFAGTGNTIAAGAGSNVLQDSGSNNTIVMPGASQGFDDIFGYVLKNGDVLDFRAALGQTSWNGTQATLGNFLHVTMSNNNAVISLSTTSGGSAVQIAELQDSGSLNLSGLLAHAVT